MEACGPKQLRSDDNFLGSRPCLRYTLDLPRRQPHGSDIVGTSRTEICFSDTVIVGSHRVAILPLMQSSAYSL